MNFKEIIKNKKTWLYFSIVYLLLAIFLVFLYSEVSSFSLDDGGKLLHKIFIQKVPPLNKKDYDRRIDMLSHVQIATSTLATTTSATSTKTSTSTKPALWPVKTIYPNDGAILPFKRIVAYYGNFLSTKMGVLGEYPEAEMLSRLDAEVKKWELADPETPVLPAVHYIAITAQGRPGEEGKYRLRMPDEEIEKALAIAKKINAIVFLDIQIGQSTIQEELPLLEKYLKMPEVHLGIDPEFSMKDGKLPGIYVGNYDAVEINYAIEYLAKLVKDNNLTPKVLVVHRYTQNMVTNYKQIKIVPEVQIVMNMDGWGPEENKVASYTKYIYKEPVQFTGFKLFYKNDLWKPSTAMMKPERILKLTPSPIYIQYQ